MNVSWQKIRLSDHRFLAPLQDLYGDIEVENFTQDDSGKNAQEFSRMGCDGVITLRGLIGGRWVGIIYNDFRVNGGSFGKACALRATEFVRVMDAQGCALVFALNSLGLRIMEGRTAAQNAFSLVPALKKFSKNNLLITVTIGRCLGLGAILFALGKYRIGIRGGGLLNLAGPEVMRLFFGAKVVFEELASVERNFEQTTLVHELLADKTVAFKRIRQLVLAPQTEAGLDFPESVVVSAAIQKSDPRLVSILSQVGEVPLEVFGQRSAVVRAFIVKRKNRRLGVLINPPGNVNNMVTCATLQKYSDALDFFKSLRLPVLSFLDAPGIDPRVEQMDGNILQKIVDVTSRMIDYPHGLMGVMVGRGFGGSNVLGFPKCFGSNRVIALTGAQIGIMHESIVDQLLSGSPRLQEQWDKALSEQTPDLKDLLAEGIIDALIDQSELDGQVEIFVRGLESPVVRRPQVPLLRRQLTKHVERPEVLAAATKSGARSRHSPPKCSP